MDSEFLADASFVCRKAFMTASVPREEVEYTLYTGTVYRVCQKESAILWENGL